MDHSLEKLGYKLIFLFEIKRETRAGRRAAKMLEEQWDDFSLLY